MSPENDHEYTLPSHPSTSVRLILQWMHMFVFCLFGQQKNTPHPPIQFHDSFNIDHVTPLDMGAGNALIVDRGNCSSGAATSC